MKLNKKQAAELIPNARSPDRWGAPATCTLRPDHPWRRSELTKAGMTALIEAVRRAEDDVGEAATALMDAVASYNTVIDRLDDLRYAIVDDLQRARSPRDQAILEMWQNLNLTMVRDPTVNLPDMDDVEEALRATVERG